MAKTIAPSDNSTSTMLDPTGPEITCGKIQVTTHIDVLYDAPTSVGMAQPINSSPPARP